MAWGGANPRAQSAARGEWAAPRRPAAPPQRSALPLRARGAGICGTYGLLTEVLRPLAEQALAEEESAAGSAASASGAGAQVINLAWRYASLTALILELHSHLVQEGLPGTGMTQRALNAACIALASCLRTLRRALVAVWPASRQEAAAGCTAGTSAAIAAHEVLTSAAAAVYGALALAISGLGRERYVQNGLERICANAAPARAAGEMHSMLGTLSALLDVLRWHAGTLALSLADMATAVDRARGTRGRQDFEEGPPGFWAWMLQWALEALSTHLEALEALPQPELERLPTGALAHILADLLRVQVGAGGAHV